VDSPKWLPITLVFSIDSILVELSQMMDLHVGRSNICFNVSTGDNNSSLPTLIESMEFNTFLATTFFAKKLTTGIECSRTMGGCSIHYFSGSLKLLNGTHKLEIFHFIDTNSIIRLASLTNLWWLPICQYPTCSRSPMNLIDIIISLWRYRDEEYYLCNLMARNRKETTIFSQKKHERNKKT